MTISTLNGTQVPDSPEVQDHEVNAESLLAAARDGLLELEEAADALIELHCPLGKESGIYTEVQLDRKMRQEREHLPELDECAVPNELIDYLVERQMEDLIYAAELNIIEEMAYRLHVAGLSCKHMAATLHIKHRTMARRLRRARRKIRAAYRLGKYAGWYQVYLSEVRRGR